MLKSWKKNNLYSIYNTKKAGSVWYC